MNRIHILLLAALGLSSCDTRTSTVSPSLATAGSPTEVAAALGLGWNLGNQLDAWSNSPDGAKLPGDTLWGNPEIKPGLFTMLAAAGVKTVRIPTTWLDAVGEAPEYRIDSIWMNHVADIVDMVRAAGLNAIVNIHHDGADSQHWLSIKDAATGEDSIARNKANARIRAQLTAMWTQIAKKFESYDDGLIFETMNEIHDGGWGWGANLTDGGRQYAILNGWQQTCVDAIRATGGKNSTRWIAIQGYVCNPDLTIKNLRLPSDSAKRTIVSVHFYDPYEYTLNNKYEQWGCEADTAKKEKWGDEDNIDKVFGQLEETFVSKGTPVYLGEIGCVNRDTETGLVFRKRYLQYLCSSAHKHHLAPIFWDNGYTGTGREQSGLINRATLQYAYDGEEVLKIMAEALTGQK